MNNRRYGNGRWANFFRRNGVYLVLSVSLLSLALVTIGGLGEGLWQTAEENSEEERPVEQIVTNQPDDRTTTTTTTVQTTTATTTTTKTQPELYVLPLTNTVQKTFSVESPLYSETMGDWRIHTGVDFAGEEGQVVKAVARGTVTEVVEDPLWGGIVTIDHGVGVVSRYYGVKATVRVGDKPDVSAPIGTLTTIPCEAAQAPHLHFEMTVDENYVNPVDVIALEVRYAETTE